jgi:hypothetical protein
VSERLAAELTRRHTDADPLTTHLLHGRRCVPRPVGPPARPAHRTHPTRLRVRGHARLSCLVTTPLMTRSTRKRTHG